MDPVCDSARRSTQDRSDFAGCKTLAGQENSIQLLDIFPIPVLENLIPDVLHPLRYIVYS